MSVVCRRCLVSGRVQRVGYRAAAAARARSLGVTGYARNRKDGRVEVLACGPVEAVDAFIAWLWEGPMLADVDDVSSDPADESPPDDFSTG